MTHDNDNKEREEDLKEIPSRNGVEWGRSKPLPAPIHDDEERPLDRPHGLSQK